MRRFPIAVCLVIACVAPAGGCEKKSAPAATPVSPAPAKTGAAPGHGDGHGATTALGEQSAGGYTLRASRDGEIKAGGEAAIDVRISGGARPNAVRLWIGSEDAKGSVKARAEIEDSKDPEHWHAHVEVPDPLPAGGRVWVSVEGGASGTVTVSFAIGP